MQPLPTDPLITQMKVTFFPLKRSQKQPPFFQGHLEEPGKTVHRFKGGALVVKMGNNTIQMAENKMGNWEYNRTYRSHNPIYNWAQLVLIFLMYSI